MPYRCRALAVRTSVESVLEKKNKTSQMPWVCDFILFIAKTYEGVVLYDARVISSSGKS